MPERAPSDEPLDRECRALARYLLGRDPEPAVLALYREGCAHPGATARTSDALDRALVAVARRGPRSARLADSFAVVFRRHGTLRRRLVLLLAILESRAPTDREVDRVRPGGPARFVLAAAASTLAFAGRLALALPLVLHAALRARRAPTSREGPRA